MNYQNKLLELVKTLDYKPKLLLHSCCGPCSTTCLSFLIDYFDVYVYYYNPNIEPWEEYEKRKREQIRFINEFAKDKIHYIDGEYENSLYTEKIKGLEEEKEGGARCRVCFYLRLEKTALKAKELGCEYFGTTLTVSPYKNSKVINEIGATLEEIHGIKFLYSDFKKNDGYKKSVEMRKKYNLYSQDYCGCSYGRNMQCKE